MRAYTGERRGALALTASCATALICVAVAAWSPAAMVVNAVIILLISLAGLHVAAWTSHERKLPWQILDYALDLVTLVALIAALAGVQQSAVAEISQSEFARRKAEQASLVYTESMTGDNSWARNILVREEAAAGSWKGLYDEAHRFIDGSRRTQSVLD